MTKRKKQDYVYYIILERVRNKYPEYSDAQCHAVTRALVKKNLEKSVARQAPAVV